MLQRDENPCVGGSIPFLAINRIKEFQPKMRWPVAFTEDFTPVFNPIVIF
jgi:hypothetical protein